MHRLQIVPVISIFLLGIFACRKNEPLTTTEYTTKSDIQFAARSLINVWAARYNKMTPSHANEINNLINSLDYSDVNEIERPDRDKVLLVRIKTNDQKGRAQYLAITESNSLVRKLPLFDGIYAGHSLELIKQAITTNQLPKNESVTVYRLSGKPSMEWEKTEDGKMLIKMAKPKNKLPNDIKISSATPGNKMARASDEDMVCTDWYWIVYNVYTGEILYSEYLYTSCADQHGNGSGGSGDGNSNNSDFNPFEGSAANTEETSIYAGDPPDQTSGRNSDFVDQGEKAQDLIKYKSVEWIAVKGLTWKVHSVEKAKLKYSKPYQRWEAVDFTHVSLSLSGGIVGGTLTVELVDATPSVGLLHVGMELKTKVLGHAVKDGSPLSIKQIYTSHFIADIRALP